MSRDRPIPANLLRVQRRASLLATRVANQRLQARQILDPQHPAPLLEDAHLVSRLSSRVTASRRVLVRLAISAWVGVRSTLTVLPRGVGTPVGFVALENGFAAAILKTTDGGNSWKRLEGGSALR